MPVKKEAAIKVTNHLDYVANLISKNAGVLGINQNMAETFAKQCDLISDRIERNAGVVRNAENFNAENVGREVAGPLENQNPQSKEYLNGEFTNQENRELRTKVESNRHNGLSTKPDAPSPGKQASVASEALGQVLASRKRA